MPLPGAEAGTVALRGLNIEDLSHLMQNHRKDIDKIVDAFKGQDSENIDYQAMVSKFLASCPGLVSQMVALSADEPEAAPKVRKMPLPLQMNLVMGVAQATFEEAGGVKKFLETLTVALTTTMNEIDQATLTTLATSPKLNRKSKTTGS